MAKKRRGRPRSSQIRFVEDLASISASQIPKDNLFAILQNPTGEPPSVTVWLTWPDGTTDTEELEVKLSYPYFGGFRIWFSCPQCHRRVGRLYIPSRGIYACRRCLGLAYESQYRKSADDQALYLAVHWDRLTKAQRERRLLRLSPGAKPQGLR